MPARVAPLGATAGGAHPGSDSDAKESDADDVASIDSDDDWDPSDSEEDTEDKKEGADDKGLGFIAWIMSLFDTVGKPDPYFRKYCQLKERNTALLLTLRITEPWTWDFYDIFMEMDEDGGGEIEIEEFLEFYGLEQTAFSDRIFNEFDRDNSGGLNYPEFIAAFYNYCSSTDEDLLKYAFDMYDVDGNDSLVPAECASLLRMIFAEEQLDETLKEIINEMDSDGDGEVDFDELVEYCQEHPIMIEPMIMMRTILRNSICGARYWQEVTEWRQRQFGPHTDMTLVLRFKDKSEAELASFVQREETVKARFQVAKAGQGDEFKGLRLRVLVRKVVGLPWLQWVRCQCRMALLERHALAIQLTDNLKCAELRQEWHGVERNAKMVFREMESPWKQQRDRLKERHLAERKKKTEIYTSAETSKIEMNLMAKEVILLKRSQGKRGKECPNQKEALRQVKNSMLKKAKNKALKEAEAEYVTQFATFEASNVEILAELEHKDEEILSLLLKGNRQAWCTFVHGDVMAEVDDDLECLRLPSELQLEASAEAQRLHEQMNNQGGFVGLDDISYTKDETKQGALSEDLPFCPQCNGRGSSKRAKFCATCGHQLYLKGWDDNLDAVTYQSVATGDIQLSTPRAQGT